jgi:hypothetical protein
MKHKEHTGFMMLVSNKSKSLENNFTRAILIFRNSFLALSKLIVMEKTSTGVPTALYMTGKFMSSQGLELHLISEMLLDDLCSRV